MRVTLKTHATFAKHGGVSKISDIQRRITMLWDSRGSAQVKASISEMSGGLRMYRRELRGMGQEQGYIDKQTRAFGTTLRYALAGGALFGTVNAIKTLGDFQAKLGEISAIGASGKFPLVGQQLDDLGAKMLKVSTDSATPINEIEDAVTNLYSTINNLSPDSAVEAIKSIAAIARVSQADITDTTQSVLGLMSAFGQTPEDVKKIGDKFFTVTAEASGGANFAKIYAQQLGKLAQSGKQGRFSEDEIMALSIAGSKFGGSPASNLRAQAQLMRNILTPGNPTKSEPAYERAGVGKAARANMGGYEVLMKLLQYGNSLPKSAQPDYFAQIGTRAETRNQLTTYAALLDQGQIKAGSGNKTIDQYMRDLEQSAGAADKAMGRAMDLRRIQQAGIAMSNFSIAFAGAFNPILQPAAKGITKGSTAFQDLTNKHPHEVMIGAGAVGAALLLMRKFTTRAPGLGGLAAVGAVGDTLSGGHQRGDSPVNPLYVIVVSQLIGGPKLMPGRGQFPRGQGPLTKEAARDAERAAERSRMAKLGRFARWGERASPFMRIGGPLAVAGMVLATNGGAEQGGDRSAFPRINRLLKRLEKGDRKFSPAESEAIGALGNYSAATAPKPRLKAAEAILDGAVAAGLRISGNATVTVNVDSTDAKGNTKRKTTKVPLPLFGDFTQPAPQTAGKNKTKRGN